MKLAQRFAKTCLLALLALAALQPNVRAASPLAVQESTVLDRFTALIDTAVDALKTGAISDPNTLNGVIGMLPAESGLAQFLKDVQLRFKVFDASDSSGDASLGFEYGFEKHITRSGDPKSNASSWWAADFYGFGNVAFDQEVNPDDFLRTGFKIHAQGYRDDAPILEAVKADALQAAILKAATFTGTPEQVDASPEWRALEQSIRDEWASKITYQAFWDYGANVAIESNQDFSRRQYTYGFEGGAIVRSPQPTSALSRMNVFDYPTALLRYLTGAESSFQPKGDYVPALLVGVDLVDPKDEDVRKALDDDPFPRFRFELESRPVAAKFGGKEIYLGLDWRFYQEIDAPASVKRNDLDQDSMFQASLDMPGGWSVSYAAGQLPLDQRDSSQFALGFDIKF